MRNIKNIICISICSTMLLTGCLKEEDLYGAYNKDSSINTVTENNANLDYETQLTTKQYMFAATCLEYNMQVPYVQGGRAAGSLNKYYEGITEEDIKDENIRGLDSEGYVKWLYQSIFNKDIFEGTLASYLDKCIQVSDISSLQIGDICLIDDSFNAKLYGVVAYIDHDGTVLVSLCDSRPSEKFITGSTRLAYIKSQYNGYYEKSLPVDFNLFYRLNVQWGS